jgi:hypothetical protein
MKRASLFLVSPGVWLVRLRLLTQARLYFWAVSPLVVALRQSGP